MTISLDVIAVEGVIRSVMASKLSFRKSSWDSFMQCFVEACVDFDLAHYFSRQLGSEITILVSLSCFAFV